MDNNLHLDNDDDATEIKKKRRKRVLFWILGKICRHRHHRAYNYSINDSSASSLFTGILVLVPGVIGFVLITRTILFSSSSSPSQQQKDEYHHLSSILNMPPPYAKYELETMQETLDRVIIENYAGGPQWIHPHLLVPVDGNKKHEFHHDKGGKPGRKEYMERVKKNRPWKYLFRVQHNARRMKWEEEYDKILSERRSKSWKGEQHEHEQEQEQQTTTDDDDDPRDLFKPVVDYTSYDYEYPPILTRPPSGGGYPRLKTMEQIMTDWPQDEDIPHESPIIRETLMHFNFSDPQQRKMARRFRDAELPFKLTDVPEVLQASVKWTDDYLASRFPKRRPSIAAAITTAMSSLLTRLFGSSSSSSSSGSSSTSSFKMSTGYAQESKNHFFAFYVDDMWDAPNMGLPPVRINDWTFEEWAKHARYADMVSLKEDQPHFYWQSGVSPEERYKPNKNWWTFISQDLPSFSSPTETFFVFHPELQKGIQCRFGERGVVAATHYDSGRNMIAMVTGAKRYILSPPNQCTKLGISVDKSCSYYRHSLLDFGHIKYNNNSTTTATATDGNNNNDQFKKKKHKQINENDDNGGGGSRLLRNSNTNIRNNNNNNDTDDNNKMSDLERIWLERAAKSKVVETVLKQGEVLYLPSFWFHYIISLQKSAQCNVRSGPDKEGTKEFGSQHDVTDACRV